MEFAGICLITDNVSRLTEFYSRILSVEVEGDDTHVELKIRGDSITIFSVEGMESMAPGSMQGAGYGSLTIGFKVDDVDLEYERVRAMGVEIVKLPETYTWGTRSFWFKDPDGNIVNFFSEVK
ncbi:MAG: VOC family protein [Halanaerobiales bacterium]